MRDIKRGVRTEDEFISTIKKIVKYVVRHREISIWVGIGVLAGVVLLFFFFSGSEQQKPEADLLHTQAMGLISMGRLTDAEKILLDLTQKYQNTRPGKIGLYYLGVVYYHSGQFDQALNYFDKFLNLQRKDFLLLPAALMGAGCAAEGLKDYEKALTYYEKLIKYKDSPFYTEGLLAYGRVNGAIGNIDKAQEVLKNLLTQNPATDIAADAKFYLGYFNR